MNQQSPTFSILTPTHNRPELVHRAIESAFVQTDPDWEMIIIDDSSDQRTYALLGDTHQDARIFYHRNPENRGVHYSRNRALDLARGQWIVFLDDDDYLTADFLEQTRKKIREHPQTQWFISHKITPSGTLRYNRYPEGDRQYTYLDDILLSRKIRGDTSHAFARVLCQDVRFDDVQPYGGEWSFWYRIGKKAPFLFHHHHSTVCTYLPDGLTRTIPPREARLNMRLLYTTLASDGVPRLRLLRRCALGYAASYIRPLLHRLRGIFHRLRGIR